MSKIFNEVRPLNYIGGKIRMAGTIAAMEPASCNVYAEPFCGSSAIALNSRKYDVKILNDLNPHIANFWRVITDPSKGAAFLERLNQTRYSLSQFEEAKEHRERFGANRDDPIDWAVDTYVLNRQSFNASGDYWVPKDPTAYYAELPKLPLMLKLLHSQKFQVFNDTAIECMRKNHLLDNEKAFIYLDPPYIEGLRSVGKLYHCDMPDTRDHIILLKEIQSAKAKIVLSGYWSGRDDGSDLYDAYLIPYGWHRHLLGEYTKSCQTSAEKSSGLEWVWCNYDLAKEAPQSLSSLKSYCAERKRP